MAHEMLYPGKGDHPILPGWRGIMEKALATWLLLAAASPASTGTPTEVIKVAI